MGFSPWSIESRLAWSPRLASIGGLLALTDAIRHGTVREPSGVPVTATAADAAARRFVPAVASTDTDPRGSRFNVRRHALHLERPRGEQQEGKA